MSAAIFHRMSESTLIAAALDDRYEIQREIGSGGMAVVYLARDRKLDREVALKVLRPELGAVLGAERFLAEIKITARLDHPHILKLIDSGEAAHHSKRARLPRGRLDEQGHPALS
jgi:eukaryotic-like serine/threonine-protein kinase